MDFNVNGGITVRIPALEQLLPHLVAFMDSAATPAQPQAAPAATPAPVSPPPACTCCARLHGACNAPRYAGSHSPCCGPHDSAYLHHGPDCKGGC